MDWETLFCEVDDFCRMAEPLWQQRMLTTGLRRRRRAGRLISSEIMTIIIAFHRSDFRTFAPRRRELPAIENPLGR